MNSFSYFIRKTFYIMSRHSHYVCQSVILNLIQIEKRRRFYCAFSLSPRGAPPQRRRHNATHIPTISRPQPVLPLSREQGSAGARQQRLPLAAQRYRRRNVGGRYQRVERGRGTAGSAPLIAQHRQPPAAPYCG